MWMYVHSNANITPCIVMLHYAYESILWKLKIVAKCPTTLDDKIIKISNKNDKVKILTKYH